MAANARGVDRRVTQSAANSSDAQPKEHEKLRYSSLSPRSIRRHIEPLPLQGLPASVL